MEREALLKCALTSAEGSTRHRARVSKGKRGGSIRRAWRAERREDWCAREGGGEGRARRIDSVSETEEASRRELSTVCGNFSGLKKPDTLSGSCSDWPLNSEAVDWRRRLLERAN